MLEKVCGGGQLAAVAGAPEGTGDGAVVRWFGAFDEDLHPVRQAQCRGILKRRPSAQLDEPVRRPPLAEAACVGERGAAPDDGARGFDVGARLEESVEHEDIVVARRPVQWGLAVGSVEAGVGVRAGRHEDGDDRGTAREMTGPVREDVQQAPAPRSVAVPFDDPRSGQSGMFGEALPERRQVTGADRLGHREGQRILRVERFHPRPPARRRTVRPEPSLPENARPRRRTRGRARRRSRTTRSPRWCRPLPAPGSARPVRTS